MQLAFARKAAQEKRRELLEGKGRPILTAEVGGQRAIVVGSEILFVRDCRTFSDFLFDYVRQLFGRDWWLAEVAKPTEQWHPVMTWHESVAHLQRRQATQPAGTVYSAPLTVAARLLLQLAYDLYTLSHNLTVRDTLLQRLRGPVQFPGACYEAHVAASLVRAGFDVAFEDEADRSTSHCEFTAIHRPTGRHFSVEAKHRDRAPPVGSRTGHRLVGNRLRKALQKRALHDRVVFLDVPVAHVADGVLPEEYRQVLGYFRTYERQRQQHKAYVVVTNVLDVRDLDSTSVPWVGMQDSIGIPDARLHATFRTIGEARASRAQHQAMLDLVEAMRLHHEIPSTFDGEFPEFAFEQSHPRLIVGQRYNVPDKDGQTVAGILLSATVLESEKKAAGVYELDDGRRVICTTPLTEAEMRAYRRQPETFFDVIQYVGSVSDPNDVLAKYDFLMATYGTASKDTLLGFMKGSPNFGRLERLDQATLAHLYCEQMAHQMVRRHQEDRGRRRPGPTP